jgi:GNAT superfamily N-acetyltransferase
MMDRNGSGLPTTYQIRIKGIVNRSIASLFDDISILPQENNETLLVGTFIDQPALRGLLDQLWNLNITILSVERIAATAEKETPMALIRGYSEKNDAQAVGRLIAETYCKFNLGFASPAEQEKLLGPFCQAGSEEPAHQEAIARTLRAEKIFVAEDHGEIVGVLRCRKECLQSLFVRGDHHRQGIGRRLVEHCETWCASQGSTVIRLAATLYAVPFYEAMGYKKSTGVRRGWSFEGQGLQYQPMLKRLTSRR